MLSDRDKLIIKAIMGNVKDNFAYILATGKDNYIDEEISTLNNKIQDKTLKPEVEQKLRTFYSISIDKLLVKVINHG